VPKETEFKWWFWPVPVFRAEISLFSYEARSLKGNTAANHNRGLGVAFSRGPLLLLGSDTRRFCLEQFGAAQYCLILSFSQGKWVIWEALQRCYINEDWNPHTPPLAQRTYVPFSPKLQETRNTLLIIMCILCLWPSALILVKYFPKIYWRLPKKVPVPKSERWDMTEGFTLVPSYALRKKNMLLLLSCFVSSQLLPD
jgi:hypothetical protein